MFHIIRQKWTLLLLTSVSALAALWIAGCSGDTIGEAFFLSQGIPTDIPAPSSALITETFENGANGWTLVNGSQPNKWMIGSSTSYNGSYSAYISNNGSSNAYSISSNSTVHMFKDITFPTSSYDFTLSFYFKGYGESTYDYMNVLYSTTSYTPSAGSTFSSGTLLGSYNQTSSWTNKTITLPASTFSGRTVRLVFSWINDGSQGTQPPAAIDNITIRYVGGGGTSVPGVPSSIYASATSSSSIDVSWYSVPGATEYRVYRSTSSSGAYSYVGSTTYTSYTNTGLSSGTTYYYKVSAYNGAGESPLSSYTYATTTASSAVLLNETFENGANGWTLVNGTQTNKWMVGTSTSYSGSYSAYISNNSSSNAYSIASSSIVHIYKDVTFPTSSSDFTLSFYFKGYGESTYDYMTVRHSTTSYAPSAGSTFSSGTLLGSTYNQNSSWTQKTITLPASTFSGRTVRLVFSWINDASQGTQPPAAIDNITINYAGGGTSPSVPGVPTSVSASAQSSSSIYVSWSSVSGASEYYVYRSTSSSGTYSYVTSTTSTSYTNTGLSSGTTYYYKVSAYNSAGESSYSSYASATTMTTSVSVPAAPSSVFASAESSSSIDVSWSSVSGATGYNVYRSMSSTGTYSYVGSTTYTSYTNDELSSGTTYYYKVSAYNNAGESSYSSYAYATTTTTSVPTSVPFTETFENGANGWTLVNGSQTNKWIVGTSTNYSGYYSAYISNNSSSNAYSINSSSTVHMYKDITFPTSSSNFTLSFYFKGYGESTYDYMTVRHSTTSYTPSAGSTFSSGTLLGSTYNQNSSWTQKTITLPASTFSGRTVRLVFSWINDASQGTQPPAAIDDITVDYAGNNQSVPGAPSSVSASAQSSNSIYVSWSSVSGASEYYVYRSTSYSGTYSYVTSTTSTSYTNTGLSSGTTYYYKVSASNSAGEGSQSTYASATTTTSAPGTPSNVTATAASSSSITVSWSSVSGAAGYSVYRSTTPSGTYSYVTNTTATSYTNTGLSASTTYYYKVSAYNSAGGEGSQSSYTYATTPAVVSIPGTPANVTATAASSSSITVSWTSVSGASGYYVYRSTSSSGTYSYVTSTTSASYTDNTGLSTGTTYYYKVSAYNSAGDGPLSTYAYATTKPGTPIGVTASAASAAPSSSIEVSWSDVSGATGYKVYRSTSSSGTYSCIADSLTLISYTDTGLPADTPYYYKVSAYNSAGEGSLSSVVSARTEPETVPTDPDEGDEEPED